MYCTKCGANLVSAAKFCASCGAEVVTESMEGGPKAAADPPQTGPCKTGPKSGTAGGLLGAFTNSQQQLSGKQVLKIVVGMLVVCGVGAFLIDMLSDGHGLGLIGGDPAKDAAIQIVEKGLRSPDSFSLVSYKEFWSGKAADGKNAYVSRVVFNAQNGFGASIRGCQLLAFKLQSDQMSWNPITGVRDCSEWPDDQKLDPELLALIQKYDFGGGIGSSMPLTEAAPASKSVTDSTPASPAPSTGNTPASAATVATPGAKSESAGSVRSLNDARDWTNVAVPELDRGAHAGDSAAMVELAFRAESGRDGAKDLASAASWFARAAALGNSRAQTNLGWLYVEGQGVPKDDVAAIRYFQAAAAQNDPKAEDSLGWMYQHGKGVPKDLPTAIVWYRKAAAQGFERSKINLLALERAN
jgi:Sel1 repeat-containing protein/zinc ribbon protein